MKKIIRRIALLCWLCLAVGMTACGSGGESSSENSRMAMAAEELAGTWIDGEGNMLSLDVEENLYVYRTWYGRIGTGAMYSDDGVLRLEFDNFLYDFEADESGFILRQEGSGKGESLDGLSFTRADSDLPVFSAEMLDGIWQNALGETLVIDTERLQYIACTTESMFGGTISNKDDGKGPYLFLNGFAYPRISADGCSFELFFFPSETQTPDGTFSGVFYKDGNAAEYADIENREFLTQDGRLWYFDGTEYFAVPDGYALGEDGLAYNADGKVFGAGWEAEVFDPATIWGEDWAQSWDKY